MDTISLYHEKKTWLDPVEVLQRARNHYATFLDVGKDDLNAMHQDFGREQTDSYFEDLNKIIKEYDETIDLLGYEEQVGYCHSEQTHFSYERGDLWATGCGLCGSDNCG